MRGRVLAVAIWMASWPAAARAAGPTAPPPSTAKALLRQGAALFTHEDYEGARGAFAHAYALDPRAATLFDLALSELNANHPVQAAAHLRAYLTHTDEPAAKLESARTKWLPRAEEHIAKLEVFAPAGAELTVDGVVQEPSTPAAGSAGSAGIVIAIATGEHEVSAHQGTFSQAQHVTASAGQLVEVHFQRVPDAPAAAAPAIAWAGRAPARERAEAAPPTRATWIAVVALGSGAVLAAGLGVAFGVASRSQAAEAQRVQGAIAPGSAWTSRACAGPSALCTELQSDVDANRRDWTLSVASYVGAGVLGAASLAAWLLGRRRLGAVVARPTVGARSAGFVLDGRW